MVSSNTCLSYLSAAVLLPSLSEQLYVFRGSYHLVGRAAVFDQRETTVKIQPLDEVATALADLLKEFSNLPTIRA